MLRWRADRRGFAPDGSATVVIVNWNTREYLAVCLHAIARFSLSTTKVIVVDNYSTDGSRAFLRAQRRIKAVLLPANIKHGPALNIGFLLADTEYVISLDPDAFPIAAGWEAALLAPLDKGNRVSGVTADRPYAHPCGLGMRRKDFVRRKHTFTPSTPWNLEALGLTSFDCGEEITVRESPSVHLIPATRAYGPHTTGTTWEGLLYHNFYAIRHENTFGEPVDILDGVVTRADARAAWDRGVREHLGLDEASRGRLAQ